MFVNYNKVTDWTEAKVLLMLETDDKWVERALVMLYRRQTEYEKQKDTTRVKNTIGFQRGDDETMSPLARKVMAGEKLSDMELAYVRRPWHRGRTPIPTIAKYRGQIVDMLEAAAKTKLAATR
jgi:hypothetical protein